MCAQPALQAPPRKASCSDNRQQNRQQPAVGLPRRAAFIRRGFLPPIGWKISPHHRRACPMALLLLAVVMLGILWPLIVRIARFLVRRACSACRPLPSRRSAGALRPEPGHAPLRRGDLCLGARPASLPHLHLRSRGCEGAEPVAATVTDARKDARRREFPRWANRYPPSRPHRVDDWHFRGVGGDELGGDRPPARSSSADRWGWSPERSRSLTQHASGFRHPSNPAQAAPE
jgi:hypothetical protein